MIMALMDGDPRDARPIEWFCALREDRPTYVCPTCKRDAVQFHHHLDEHPGREDFYRCCACGLFWEL
jgi:hypothetical protein